MRKLGESAGLKAKWRQLFQEEEMINWAKRLSHQAKRVRDPWDWQVEMAVNPGRRAFTAAVGLSLTGSRKAQVTRLENSFKEGYSKREQKNGESGDAKESYNFFVLF